MKDQSGQIGVALVIGVAVTLVLFGLGFMFSEDNLDLSLALYWQAWLMQSAIPCAEMGTPPAPLCESVPVNAVVFWAGIPVGIVIYTLLAYAALRLFGR